MSKKSQKNNVKTHQLISGDGSKLARKIAKKTWSGSLKNHPWYDGKYNTEKGGLQAHHIITTDSVSGRFWEAWRKAYEYDINRANNGIMLPSSTKIACQVETHVHRSNHERGLDYLTVVSKYWGGNEPEEIPDEECEKLYKEELTYLKGVEKMLGVIYRDAQDRFYCESNNNNLFTKDMDNVSRDILSMLDKFYWTISRYGKDYAPGNLIGCACGNIESDKKKRKQCLHRLERKKHVIENKKGIIMKPRKLRVGA